MMKQNKSKNVMLIFILLAISVFSFSNVGASLGVGIPDNIEVYPGETKETNYYLQNVAGSEEDYVVTYTIENGAEYVDFSEEEIDLKFGKEKAIKLEINAPENTPVGTVIPVSVLFMPRTSSESGEGAQIVTNLRSSFKVIVIPKPLNATEIEQPSSRKGNIIIWIITIVLIILIVWWILKATKGKVGANNNDYITSVVKKPRARKKKK